MLSRYLLFFTIISYSIIVGQSFMYIIAMKNVQTSMQAASYIELRQLLDAGFMANFKWAIYTALLCNLLLLISTMKTPGSLLFITVVIAFAALIIDTLLAVKGNVPINTVINSWSADNYPADWADYRAKWLQVFRYRQIANISGFTSLVIGAVFGAK
jgi:hypothetical protein